VFIGGVLANPSEGALTLDCKCITLMPDTDPHHLFYEDGTLAYRCDTNGCHTWTVDNFCSAHHSGCGGGGPIGHADDLEGALSSPEAAVRLAGRRDVMFNRDRDALQIVDCNGLIIASARVPAEFRLAVLEASILKFLA
jgi:hypothetical protein